MGTLFAATKHPAEPPAAGRKVRRSYPASRNGEQRAQTCAECHNFSVWNDGSDHRSSTEPSTTNCPSITVEFESVTSRVSKTDRNKTQNLNYLTRVTGLRESGGSKVTADEAEHARLGQCHAAEAHVLNSLRSNQKGK
jgi:hypothetical protein